MRILQLTERRQQQTKLMYHGTSDVFLRSIMKNGLMADPPKRTYAGDENDPGPAGYETFGGVYISDYPERAQNSASHAVDKFGGQPMIITVQYAVGSGNLDEDHITNAIAQDVQWAMSSFYENMENGEEDMFDSFTEYYDGDPDAVVKDIVDSASDHFTQRFGNLNKMFVPLLTQAVRFFMDHVDEENVDSGAHMAVLRQYDEYTQLIQRLMQSINDDPMHMKNIQVTRNIGFRGKTKIVQIETRDGVVFNHPGQHVTY